MTFIAPGVARGLSYRLIGLVGLLAAAGSCQSDRRSLATAPRPGSAAAAVASPTTATISPTADTYLNIDQPPVAHATEDSLNVYTWPDNKIANAIVMKFDLGSILPGSTISSATLNLYLQKSDATTDPTYTVTVHKVVNKNPDIAGATGQTYDGRNPWSPSTCCYNNIPLAQSDIDAAVDTKAIDKTVGFKQWDVTSIVQSWFSNPSTNFGLLVNSDPSKLADRSRQFSSSENPATSQHPYLAVVYTPPPVPAWLVEDFSTYTSTANMKTNPRGIYSSWDPASDQNENFNISQIFLDQTTGVNIGGYALTQSMRYDFPDRTGDLVGRCGDYSIGVNLVLPTAVQEVWVEVYGKFGANFTTSAPSGWNCASNPEYKFIHGRVTGGSRFNLNSGTYPSHDWTWGIPFDEQGAGGTPPNTIPGGAAVWDGQWHQYRLHMKVSSALNVADGSAQAYLDGALLKTFTNVVINDTNIYGIALGRNMNQGPATPTSVWWGRVAMWNTDPGW